MKKIIKICTIVSILVFMYSIIVGDFNTGVIALIVSAFLIAILWLYRLIDWVKR